MRKALGFIGSGKRVLDVGAYDGQLTQKIAALGNEAVALDASESALLLARKRGLPTIHGDVTGTWPVATASFDAVFAGEIIEHVLDTDFFLDEARRVLKPGGRLVLTTPNVASLARRLLLLAGVSPWLDTALRSEQAGHVRYFTRSTIKALVEEHRFVVDEMAGDYVNLSAAGAGSAMLAALLPQFARCIVLAATAQ
jgi:2-polyprenyl-3-methyl-5-hydroxy-6-metoxy-1,4-benzoquinol methylase